MPQECIQCFTSLQRGAYLQFLVEMGLNGAFTESEK